MASDKMAQIRAKLQQMEEQSSGTRANSDTTIYPFWNMEEGLSSLLRFLPDNDPENVFFWKERQVIKLEYPGVVGGDGNKRVTVQVPCGEMYGDTCPVLTEVRPWFKDPSLEDLGRKYWKKRSYIFQGLVVEDGLREENPPENPIRRFVIGPQIFNIIKSALMDPDMDNIPIDYEAGTDFRLAKGSKGQYADYGTSKWARKERPLSENELAAIDQYGLFTLNDFLPDRPSADHYMAIKEMFEASVDGELYDPNRWGEFYKPYGLDLDAVRTKKVSATAQKPKMPPNTAVKESSPEIQASDNDNDNDVPWQEPENTESAPSQSAQGGKKSADDILNMIRQRKTA